MDQCNYINRVAILPNIKIGGSSLGQCPNEVLPGMVYCIDHAGKDAIEYYIKQLYKENKELKQKLKSKKINKIKTRIKQRTYTNG